MQSALPERIRKVCEEVLAPLIEADGGEMFLVALDADAIEIHLAGTCAGCPGATFTVRTLIEPAIQAVSPGLRVKVTSGFRIPDGADGLGSRAVARSGVSRTEPAGPMVDGAVASDREPNVG